MSFYFSYKTNASQNYKKKLERLERLIIPYILWPIIMLFINFTLKRFIKINKILTFENLKFQILYGFVINYMGALWYQWNLIFFSICYYLIPLCTKNDITFLILLINITVFILQYNGKNYDIFSKYHDGRYITFGRIVEMIPFLVLGFITASQKTIIFLFSNF